LYLLEENKKKFLELKKISKKKNFISISTKFNIRDTSKNKKLKKSKKLRKKTKEKSKLKRNKDQNK
jgi:hypothetical protein